MSYKIPAHLPRRLTISLWDFSWYTMTMPGEAFEDLEQAFAQAVERGYNTVRICAMPFLLFGPNAQSESELRISNLGGEFGQRTRWYNVRGGAVLNGRAHLLRLFEAAKKYDCYIILSSWEYQQSPSFSATDDWYNELIAVAPRERFQAQAEAMGKLIRFLKDHQLSDRIAYTELHNETEMSKLKQVAEPEQDSFAAIKPYQAAALAYLREQHADILITDCYGAAPVGHMQDLPENAQVAHFHLYLYGVLGALAREMTLWGAEDLPFPESLRALLQPDAPAFEDWRPRPGEAWRLAATGVSRRLFYVHDCVDPDKWDLWLYNHYAEYRESMRAAIQERLTAIAQWAEQHQVPAVIGEGYVGYTPLLTNFEEGPVGKDLAENAIETCLSLNFWGIILCSNSAPHHPFWQDVAWQQRWNARILSAGGTDNAAR
jgi:hypothetical protein